MKDKTILEIEEKINNLKKEKLKRLETIKKENKERKKAIITKTSNVLKRISLKFNKRIDNLNENRESEGFNKLSKPKITDLIIRHKLFQKIYEDIVHYDITMEDNGGIINEK